MGDLAGNLMEDVVCEILNEIKPRIHRPLIAVSLSNIPVRGLYDTGADVSCISEAVFKKLKDKKVNILNQQSSCTSASGDKLKVLGKYELTLQIGKKKIEHPFYVIKNLNRDLILGFDLIQAHHLNYNTETKSFSWKNGGRWHRGQLKVSEQKTLPPLSVCTIKVSVRTDSGHTPSEGVPCLVDIVSPVSPLLTGAPTMVQVDRYGNAYVQVINCSPIEQTLERNEFVGFSENIEDCELRELNPAYVQSIASRKEVKCTPPSAAKEKFIREKLNLENVPSEFRDQYLKTVLKYHEAVSQHKFDLGRANTLMHEITLKTKEPIYVKQFKIPEAHQQEVERHVAEWLKLGVVEPTRSKYNSPLFVVMKKNGGVRLVQDFRALNAASHIDKYSMKDVSECIGEIGRSGSTIFTTIDLTAGFWQMVLHPRSRPYTSFTLPGRGQFQWVCSPQGTLGCPASFQRLMETVVHGIANVIVYIDDLLLHSDSHPSHLELLDQVLRRLVQNGIKMNLEKCVLGSKRVAYLGFNLTEEGIKPGTDKLKAVAKTPPPSNVREVRQFLGLCNFFRNHVKNFAQLSAPLTKLTKKDSPWKAGELPPDALRSFRELQSCLVSEPVMAYPRKNRPYALLCDASLGDDRKAGGLGAILTQIDEKGEHQVIAYASRKLQKHEANYTPFLLEMTAAIWGMEHFSVYLRGRPFTLYSDHKPLEKLGKVHTKTFNRLQEAMNQFDFQIVYKKGEEMPADYLSRNVVASIASDSEVASQEQSKDPIIRALKDYLINKQLPISETAQRVIKHLSNDCFVENDVVWRRVKRPSEPSRVVFLLPKQLVPEVLQEAHGNLLSGHDGVFKTKERLFSCYYWPGMDKDINEHIKSCHKCQVRKKTGKPEPVLLSPLPQCTEPNQRVHVDLFGPLRVSGNQKRFIICLTDAFTKYIELAALPNKEAPVVAQAIFEKWICRHGCPLELISDKGSEFTSQLSKELYRLMNISHRTTTAYHPQCNSQAEVANKTIAKYLASFVDSSTLEWEDLLAPLMFSYNTSYHRSVKNTPFYLTFGIEPRTPVFDAPDTRKKFYGESSSGELFSRLCVARDIARLNNEDATLSYKLHYDAKAEPHQYKEGQLVLLDEHNFLKKNVKLAPKWSGPHRVLRLKGPCNVELQLDNNKKVIVHANRLKPYHLRQKNNPQFEEVDQECAIPTDWVNKSKPKRSKQTSQNETQDFNQRNDPEHEELLADWFASAQQTNRDTVPVQHPVPEPEPVLAAQSQPRPRGRPRKSYSEVVASNPSPISRQHSQSTSTATPNKDLISSRTRSKLVPSFSPRGGNEGLKGSRSNDSNTTPAIIDAQTAAFATAAVVNPQTISHLQEDSDSSSDSDNNDWVMVLRKKSKAKKDKLRQRQSRVFKHTGDTYSYSDYKNAVEFEYLDIPDPAAAAAAIPHPIQQLLPQGLPAQPAAPPQVQAQAAAQPQPQVQAQAAAQPQLQPQDPAPPVHPGPQTSTGNPAPTQAPGGARTKTSTAATTSAPQRQGNADDRPIRPANSGQFFSGPGDDTDVRFPTTTTTQRQQQPQPQRGRHRGDHPVHPNDRSETSSRPVPHFGPRPTLSRSAPVPRLQPRQPIATPPRYATIEEEEDDDDITATSPPEFVTSPSTPRSNPRYHLRPSPASTPPTDPFDPAAIRASVEAAFRDADAALFPSSFTRSKKPKSIPDDVLHRFPPERGRRSKK